MRAAGSARWPMAWAGNGGNGVMIEGGSLRNVLNRNFIGTTASGNGALGNAGNGVWIYRAPGNSRPRPGPALLTAADVFQALTAREEFHSTPRFRRSGYSSSTALYRSSAVAAFSAAAEKARR